MITKRGSTAWKAKISASLKGIPLSLETRKKMSLARMGHKVTKATRKKISLSNTGVSRYPKSGYNSGWWSKENPAPYSVEKYRKIGLAVSKRWKGTIQPDWWREKISIGLSKSLSHMNDQQNVTKREYVSVHRWIALRRGKPKVCSKCNRVGKNTHQFHWANISGKYLRDEIDWIRLCAKCHRNFDYQKNK